MKLKDVNQALKPVGLLESGKIEIFLIRDLKQGTFRSLGEDIGFFKAVVSPEGEVTVNEMHINPDMVEQVRQIFAGTDVRVGELPWC